MNPNNKIKYSLVYNRSGRLNKDGKALVQIRAYQNGRSRYFTTGIYLDPESWDEANKKVKHTHPLQFQYNKLIRDQLEAVEEFEILMIRRLGSCPLDRLDEYQDKRNEIEVQSFTEFMFQEIQDDSTLKLLSRKTYELALTRLLKFKDPVYFEDLSSKFISKFDRHLHKTGLHTNTIRKQHKIISSFINRAIQQDLMAGDLNPYRKFKFVGKEPDRVFLTSEELARIEDLQFEDEFSYMARVKDIFLFSCYTGLRFSDIVSLSRSHFDETKKGLVLQIKAKKTGKGLMLPVYMLFKASGQLQSKPEVLICKHLAKIGQLGRSERADRLQFFRISNQYYNRSLKRLAELAGIRKKITSHVARRTFATIMATKVKLPVLQKLLQHSRPDMTNIYIQLSNQAIERELEAVNWE